MNRIERYLGAVVISHSLLVLLVLLVILGFGEFMMQLGRLSDTYSLSQGTLYTLLKMPVFGYEIFPVALLIGTLIGLGGLANHAELTVLRVTGWSIGRLFWAVIKTVILLWVAVAILGELVAPKSEAYAVKIRAEGLQKNISVGGSAGFWMKEPNRLIHVQNVVSTADMRGLTIYELDGLSITGVIQARQAQYQDDQWKLTAIRSQKLALEDQVRYGESLRSLNWQASQQTSLMQVFPVDPALLERLQIESRYLRVDDLYRYIQFLQTNDLDASVYQLEFWRKVATPISILGMIALVFPLIFGSQRQVSMGQRVFVGVLIGLGFHLLNQLLGNLSVVYQLPAIFGAFVPSLILLAVAFVLFRRLR
ncbi:MAG: LPS export ABC transporter permease LptG [Thiomicrospira sp.]|uniref:LPS export ABC transporter permease LptG n=1 Tax=Thiomicrospira sp. TaxID=935 RepID=UPI0019DC1BB7|nr:LPS export ABC transporter permease LptG [Thiomicrospira sp.]MBE0493932.1 LPS export ABC transporter permease LptG [Thiomicrospira sp.]